MPLFHKFLSRNCGTVKDGNRETYRIHTGEKMHSRRSDIAECSLKR
jgi:hypothetical protein